MIGVSGVDAPGVPAWRVVAGAAVLAGIVWIGALLVPVYLHNLALEKFLREKQPAPEEVLRQQILDKGRSLGLDIVPDHLRIQRGDIKYDVRYVVRVTLPLYTVDLHFASNTLAGVK
jgi:hypothetical protein